ncbi:hypothetical protein IAU60_005748 [Kwoniella sp. DSM 27419]
MPPHAALSPTASTLSPRSPSNDPNTNPFSPLSPDLPENRLKDDGDDDEVNELLGLTTAPRTRDLVFYSRQQMLRMATQKRTHVVPPGMRSLEAWFGPVPKGGNPYTEDPAIASVGPPASSSRRGGFGEGFGFGGGIGGRMIGRGGRNIGVNSGDNRSYGGQMGRFATRAPPSNSARMGGDDDEEWRRSDRNQPRDNRRPAYHAEDEALEPAWMDDVPQADPAIVEASDPLIKFVPGEDMIAAHKRAMKSREAGTEWNNAGSSSSFFAADPAIVATSSPLSPPGFKQKSFNAANYLTRAEVQREEEAPAPQPEPAAAAFSSRFQKFFNAPANAAPVAPPKPQDPPKDDRMAKLMGLLSTKVSNSGGDSADLQSTPPPERKPERDTYGQIPSPASHPSQQVSPLYGVTPAQRPPSHPNALLQQLYDPSQDRPRPSDPLQLLAQSQQQHHHNRPQHMPIPPQFARPQPEDNLPHPAYSHYQQAPYPHGPPPGYLPPPHFYQQGPPRPTHGPIMGFPPHSAYGAPSMNQLGPPRPYPVDPAQQDMLATLFAGLGPRS